jgi:anti-sigma B factor antagonist
MKNLTITERRTDSVTILDLKGNIRLGEGSRELHEAIRLIVVKGEKEILLNLANVSYVDSSGLGELVAGYTTLQKSGGEMKLLNLTERVSELMVITKLLTVFEVYEDEEQAVNSFQNASEYIKLNQSAFVTGELDKALLN